LLIPKSGLDFKNNEPKAFLGYSQFWALRFLICWAGEDDFGREVAVWKGTAMREALKVSSAQISN
jgi:hypothetical protein